MRNTPLFFSVKYEIFQNKDLKPVDREIINYLAGYTTMPNLQTVAEFFGKSYKYIKKRSCLLSQKTGKNYFQWTVFYRHRSYQKGNPDSYQKGNLNGYQKGNLMYDGVGQHCKSDNDIEF